MNFVVALKTGKWIFNLLKHICLGNKSFAYHLRFHQRMSRMFIGLLSTIALVAVISIIAYHERGENAKLKAELEQYEGKDKKPPKPAADKPNTQPPPDGEYNSEQHAKFVQDYFNELKQHEAKDRN